MGGLSLTGLVLVGMLLLPALAAGADEPAGQWPPTFAHSKVATTLGGYHSTTRGTIRLVFPHEGKWLIFRGDPDTYHFSDDGKTWTAAKAAPQASRSHLIHGRTIYTQYNVLVEPAPKWAFDKFVCTGTISGKTIKWEPGKKIETNVSYYPDIKQDTAGHFTMTGRHAVVNEEGKVVRTEVLWKRSKHPGNFMEWGPDVRCINHTGDSGVGKRWTEVGSTAHENLVLEDGKSYVLGMMTVGGVGKLFGNLHDGRKWSSEDTELAAGMSTWPGTDRRMCAVFDAKARVIHLAYVSADGRLFYRSARPPYGPKDWSKPAELQRKTFTAVVSLDTARSPAHVYLVFGRTMYQGRDRRNTFGELYLQRFDGKAWGEPALVSEPGTKENWYPNMNEDVRRGIGILYLKGSGRAGQDEKPPLDIMFATTGPPTPAAAR